MVPFLRSEELKTFEIVSEDGMRKLINAAEKFTEAKTFIARQMILDDYKNGIDTGDAAGGFYKAMFGMTLGLRHELYSSK